MELTKKWAAEKLPKRSKDANKGTFGKVLVIAGSENFPGAAYLACAATYRVGAGLVTLATIPIVQNIVSKKLPELTFLSFNEVFEKIAGYDVLLVGSGLGQSTQAIEFVEKFCTNYKTSVFDRTNNRTKTVIDGDGLNILSKMENWWKEVNVEFVLTPHPGEMSRLTGLSVGEIQSDRVNIALKFSKSWNQIVVLKGVETVIASPIPYGIGEVGISPFANPALATAGTGDVLAGCIAGFLAQGLNLFDAACVAVYVHGMAGEMVRERMGEAGALASDLLPLLPKAIKQLKEETA